MKTWLIDRLNALLDNVLWVLLGVVILSVGGSVLAWGGQTAHLPIWLVVLFGVVEAACVVAIVMLWRRPTATIASESSTRPHPHAGLLHRAQEFRESLSVLNSQDIVMWAVAEPYNTLLSDARAQCIDKSGLRGLKPVPQTAMSDRTNMQVGQLQVLVGQVEAALRSDTRTASQHAFHELGQTIRKNT